ncbi:MAG: AEC family transporter [Oscillospiraceae bacterium]|jgi:predicted permease|nr:AEC family transporter [Oscillospiraceae bacterium]
MLNNFMTVAGQVITLFILMGVGFALRKLKRLPDEVLKTLSFLVLNIVAPCIIVNSMQIERTAERLGEMGVTALVSLVYFAMAFVITIPMFRKYPHNTRIVMRFGTLHSNLGFMGFPLIAAALGQDALRHAAIVLVVFSIILWTSGITIMGSDGGGDSKKTFSWKLALVNPGTVGFAIGIVLFGLNIKLPWPIGNAVAHVADVNTPLAMIVIGAQMADAEIFSLFRDKSLYTVSLMRLIVLPALLALVLLPFNLPPLIFATCVILFGTPVAGITSMMSQRFNRDTPTAARLVTMTTLLSVITLPVLATLVKL